MKKFTALLICLLMVITCGLAGCAGFSIDKVKYYNEVLATVGDTHITRYDLLSAYNSYGSSYYVTQQGETEQEALASTLDLLIDREALYQYTSNSENNETYKPTAYQVNSIVEEMFKSFDEQMNNYITKAKSILNIKTESVEDNSAEQETAYLFKDYAVTNSTRRAFVKDELKIRTTYYTDDTKTEVSETETEWFTTTEYVESKIVYNTDLLAEPATYDKLLEDKYLNDHTNSEIIAVLQEKYFSVNPENKGELIKRLEETEKEYARVIYNKVMVLLAKDLLQYEHYLRDEDGKAYSKNLNDLIYRYIERSYNSQIQSQYLENFRTEYLKNAETELEIDLLLKEFDKLYTKSYNSYNNREETYKNAMKEASTNADSILYHPETLKDNTKFGYFVHTLFSFNETQKTLYTTMEKLVGKDKTETKEDIIDLFSSDLENGNLIHPRNPETGLVDTSISYTLQQVIDEYNEITEIENYNEKLSAFVQFMFKYTGDTATLSAGMPYVVGTNGYSSMMQQFTDECVKLMNTGKAGEMSSVSLSNLDGMCITSYGIHFVMYVGEVDAYDYPLLDTDAAYIRFTNDEENDAAGAYNLYHKIINPLTGKTYFDMLFDAVYPASGEAEAFTSNNGYTTFEEVETEKARNYCGVQIFKDNLEGTKTSI